MDSDLWLRDASYLRLKNVQVGYNIRGGGLQRYGISNLRISATGQNLLTFDHIKVFDPEASGISSNMGIYNYPLMRVFNLGLNFTF